MHICTKNTSYLYGRIVGRSIFHGSYYGLAFFSTENTSLRFFPMLFFDRGNFMYGGVRKGEVGSPTGIMYRDWEGLRKGKVRQPDDEL